MEYYETNIGWEGNKDSSVESSYDEIDSDDIDGDKIFRNNTLPKVDRHGFVVSHELHSKVSSLPNQSLVGEIGKLREKKWLKMLSKWDEVVSKNPSKVKERCHKGIPQSVRSLAWQYLSGAKKLQEENKDVYQTLVKLHDSEWGDVIKKDIPRTFRHHCMFYEPDSQGQENLYHVLLAFSCYDKTIGYNQALAPVAAVILMHMQPEETFWLLVAICQYYLPGYYGDKMEAMRLDGMIFDSLLERTLPHVAKHMKQHNIDPLMYIVEWMVCIYARCLPFQTVLRIWDMFFCEGVKVLFKVGLSILKLNFPTEKELLDKDDFQTTQILNSLPKKYTLEMVLITEAQNMSIPEKEFERIHQTIVKKHPELNISRFSGSKK